MNPDALQELLKAISRGEINPETALEQLKNLNFEPVPELFGSYY